MAATKNNNQEHRPPTWTPPKPLPISDIPKPPPVPLKRP